MTMKYWRYYRQSQYSYIFLIDIYRFRNILPGVISTLCNTVNNVLFAATLFRDSTLVFLFPAINFHDWVLFIDMGLHEKCGSTANFSRSRIKVDLQYIPGDRLRLFINWLIIYSFTSLSRIFDLHGDVTIPGEGLQRFCLCSALGAFEQGGIFIVPHLLWLAASVFPV
jgi:hypothetical protein